MKSARLGRLAVLGAAVALAIPAVAQANEVTKWNEIAVNTINAQAPITSGPPAGAVFVAMVQGAVYGAVNAVDRHGRPYLVNRSYPKASADAAAATAAFRVLDFFFSATNHAALQTAYDASLLPIPNGASKEQGIEVGARAADAMLAEGHDGRTLIGCTFGSGLPGVWQPLAGPTGAPLCDPTPWVGNAKPFVLKSPSQFRTAGPYPLEQRRVCGGLERGQIARQDRQRHTHARPDPRRGVLADESGGELQRDCPQVRRPVLARRD